MANFQVLTDLPKSDQAEIARISAIASGQRNSVESAYLTARADYLYNQVHIRDEDDNIVSASGHTVPTGLSGFAKSATFRKTDVATGTKALYENTGDSTTAVWDLVGSVTGTEVQLADTLAPVNAVNSLSTLTASAVTAGVHAESVVTANTIIDGNTATIGSTTYIFKTALSAGPTVAYEVLIGGSDAVALDNLKLAINLGAGIGTNYSTGTVAHPSVVATTNTDTTQMVVARVTGTTANTLATTSVGGTLTWADTTLGGGTGASNPGVVGDTVTVGSATYRIVDVLSQTNGASAVANEVLYGGSDAIALDNLKLAINGTGTPGTEYATGTTQPSQAVNASTNTNTTQVVEANTAGVAGDGICACSATGGFSFSSANLTGGVNGTVGVKGQQYVGTSYVYTAIADNTISGKNWRRVSLGSSY